MSKITLTAVSLLLACTASYADNCEDIRSQIDAKIKASGVANYSVLVVDSAASASGKLVGSCARGSKKIMYTQLASPEKILTECKDGSVSVGGSCKK